MEVLPLAFNGQFHLHFYPTLGRLLRKTQPDIVHIDEEPYNLATFHANRLARHLGAKTIWFSWQNLLRSYPLPFAWMERYNLKNIDYAIVGSHTAAKIWHDKGYAGQLAVIPQFGVDPKLFTPPAQPRTTGPVHIAYVGRLVPEKGVDLLLRALADLPGAWDLTIQGSGPEAENLQTLTKTLGLHAHVKFRNQILSTEMPKFYQDMDILVLPSRARPNWTEQFGRVLVEAMACGVTVIGSETGEIPHVISDAGLTFPEDNVDAIHTILKRLIENPTLRAELSTRGRNRVLDHFTQHQIAQETVRIYRKLQRT